MPLSRHSLAAGIAVAALGAGAAHAAPDIFPPSADAAAVTRWLPEATGIRPADLLTITPDAATAVAGEPVDVGGGVKRLALHAEALTPDAARRVRALSWQMTIDVDCTAHTARLGEVLGYSARGLAGRSFVMRPADANWRAAASGTIFEHALRRICAAESAGTGATARPARPLPTGGHP
jgi:hypothetical protein